MSENKIMRSKWFLYATEFFSGVSVMAIELGASRLMAPYFSSSQIVWTIIIGTIMIAMAIGNVVGGRLADKNPHPSRLYGRLLIAAVWTAAIPFVGKYIITGISLLLMNVVKTNFLIWASFATCLILFVFPLMILGTVTPSLVKYTTQSLKDNGKTVGELGALNTIGSIIGTFLPTFVTIPAVGTSATFIIFASVLALLAFIYFIFSRTKLIKSAVAAVLIVAFGAGSMMSGFAFWDTSLVHEDESIYNYIQVKEDAQSVILSTNVLFGVQSIKMKNTDLSRMFYDYTLAGPLMTRTGSDSDVLVLGLGAGTFPSQCEKYFPGSRIDGVEIDSKIADLAKQYFDMPDSVNVYIEDGRAFIAHTEKKYDMIMVDAYQDITIPFQMSTIEFFEETKKCLKENGVLILNMNMLTDEAGSINEYLCDTVASVYKNVYTADVTGYTNRMVYATENDSVIRFFHEEITEMEEGDFRAFMFEVSGKLSRYDGGDLILTDDKAPVELLGMKVLDSLIESNIEALRGQDILGMFM